MGVNPSKFVKHSYVVSEGVQTDLRIESFKENNDNDTILLCKTPPRQLHRLSDPRSATRGIVRTPILCESYDGKDVLSPVKEKRKPYLETNLDDLLPHYIPPDPCDHLTDMTTVHAHVSLIHQSCKSESVGSLSVVSELKAVSKESINIYIPDIDENEPGQEDNMLTPDHQDQCLNDSQPDDPLKEQETDFSSLVVSSTVKEVVPAVDCRYKMDRSETVEIVCQRIVDELLNSKDDICLEDSGDELFVDDDDSLSPRLTEPLRNLVIRSQTLSPVKQHSPLPLTYHENYNTPTSSNFNSKTFDKSCHPTLDQQPCYTPSPRKQRKPLGEVNRNIQAECYQGPLSSLLDKASSQGVDSPLKTMLPLLQPQSAPQVKPHRSHWDTENTLII